MAWHALEVLMYAAIHTALFCVLLVVVVVGGMFSSAASLQNQRPERVFKCLEFALYAFAPTLLVPRFCSVKPTLPQAVLWSLPSAIIYGIVVVFLVPAALGTVMIIAVVSILLIGALVTFS